MDGVEIYPCPACGGVADEDSGCRDCGRPHDPLAAELARIGRTLDTSAYDDPRRAALKRRSDQLIAQIGRNLVAEHAAGVVYATVGAGPGRGPAPAPPPGTGARAPRQAKAGGAAPASYEGPTRRAAQSAPAGYDGPTKRPAPGSDPDAARYEGTTDRTPPAEGAASAYEGPTSRATPRAPRSYDGPTNRPPVASPPDEPPPDAGPWRAAGDDEPEHHQPHLETTSRTSQNVLLTLGGLLLGIGAIVYATVVLSGGASGGGQAFILVLATTVALALPVALARRSLNATAETIASFGLLLVLLDGFVAYRNEFGGLADVPPKIFAAVLFGLTAAIAAAYRLATRLAAPQFVALVAVQPILPLVAAHAGVGRTGFAVALAALALADLAAALLIGRDQATSPVEAAARWPGLLRETAWGLYGLALAGAVVFSLVSLSYATTVPDAAGAATALILAAAAGIAGGYAAADARWRLFATAGGTLAIILALLRLDAVAAPGHTVILAAALAAAVAVLARVLPESVRAGAELAALVTAAVAAIAVTFWALYIAVGTVKAAVDPEAWAADLSRYASHLHPSAVDGWQVPIAALLLTVVAYAATPEVWRREAVVFGGVLFVLSLPATGVLAWWAIPIISVLGSAACAIVALGAPHGPAALLCSGSATLLAAHAAATSLARPGLTAATFALGAAAGAAVAVLAQTRPGWSGPYADRVGDLAGGGATVSLPVAVYSLASLLEVDAPARAAVGLFAVAVSVAAAALAQLAGETPRTITAGGAVLVALVGLVYCVRLLGLTNLNVPLAVLLLASAVAVMGARVFEVTVDDGGNQTLFGAARMAPSAFGAYARAASGDHAVSPPLFKRRDRPFDGVNLGAAGATGGLAWAVAGLVGLAAPGIDLVLITAMVVLLSVGVSVMPEEWQRGPRLGAAILGGLIAAVTASVAVLEAARVIAAGMPWGVADLSGWTARASATAPFGWQVPATLLLAAAAAVILLPSPNDARVGFVALSLAGLSMPAALALPWWSPVLIAGVLAVAVGIGAALIDHPMLAQERLVMAALLGTYAVAAAMVRPEAVTAALAGVVIAGLGVAALAVTRGSRVTLVPGVAVAAGLVAAPGAVAAGAAAAGAPRSVILTLAMGAAALGVPVLAAASRWPIGAPAETEPDETGQPVRAWLTYAVAGVGLGAFAVVLAALPDWQTAGVYAAVATLIAAAATATMPMIRLREGATLPTNRATALVATAGPPAVIAVGASAPAWLTALFGPYQTLRAPWNGYADTPLPPNADSAAVTLALLTLAAAAAALALGGRRYVFAAALPPAAAFLLVLPTALDAARPVTAWVAFAIALATGLGAALVKPTVPAATKQLRTTAGVICALTGAAGIAGSLATPGATLVALGVAAFAAGLIALLGRDPVVRRAAWLVASAAALALPVTAFAAVHADLRTSAFFVLAVAALLVGLSWVLARPATAAARPGEAAVVELGAYVGSAFALLLTLDSLRYTAAVLMVWGVLLGAAALRRDRTAQVRIRLVIGACLAELGAVWLLMAAADVAVIEAYTVPFALVAVIAGAIELRYRSDLSSWLAYGPALAAGFLPSVLLAVVGEGELWRRIALFIAGVAVLAVGAATQLRAPTVIGAAVAIIVALHELVLLALNSSVAGYFVFALGGLLLLGLGATFEKRRRDVVRIRGRLRRMS